MLITASRAREVVYVSRPVLYIVDFRIGAMVIAALEIAGPPEFDDAIGTAIEGHPIEVFDRNHYTPVEPNPSVPRIVSVLILDTC